MEILHHSNSPGIEDMGPHSIAQQSNRVMVLQLANYDNKPEHEEN